MIIQTMLKDSSLKAIINTDHISCVVATRLGCEIHLISGGVLDVLTDYDELEDILVKESRRKNKIDTGTVNVKILNPH